MPTLPKSSPRSPTRLLAHAAIRFYQLTFSAFVGRQCRHLPSCSDYTDEAIQKHGLWMGGWMGAARICRCHPFGTSGFDPVPTVATPHMRWWAPWRYGRWGGGEADLEKRLHRED